ncbi:unnamed protein product [Rotaria sp. Silwood2]|nr:unnamed protein product [Rotaria sp. Silwood2]CAF4473459.1 unnamed protein product [Rotaria sp. Silwood2]
MEFLAIPESVGIRWNSREFLRIPTDSVSDTISELVGGVPDLVKEIPELLGGIWELGWRDSGIGGTDSAGGTGSGMCNIAE